MLISVNHRHTGDSIRAAEFGRRARNICRIFKRGGGGNENRCDSVSASAGVESVSGNSKHADIECKIEEDVTSSPLFMPTLLKVRIEVRNAARILFTSGRHDGAEIDLLKVACCGVQGLETFLLNSLQNISDCDGESVEIQRDQSSIRVGLEFARNVSRNILSSNYTLITSLENKNMLATDLFLKCDTLRSSLRNLGVKIEDT